jgi:hypothetical protein
MLHLLFYGFEAKLVSPLLYFLSFYLLILFLCVCINNIISVAENYDRPMYIMIDLAIGGGSSRNNETNLDKGPQDLLVQYPPKKQL